MIDGFLGTTFNVTLVKVSNSYIVIVIIAKQFYYTQ